MDLVKSCDLPVAMKNPNSKFRIINPSTQTVASSWSNIVHTLMRAEDNWWKCEDTENDPYDESSSEHDDDSGEFATAKEEDDANLY